MWCFRKWFIVPFSDKRFEDKIKAIDECENTGNPCDNRENNAPCAVGYSVALFFVIFKAPDLALTQLVIETISVALFLLAFKHLPALNNHGETKPNKLMNLIIAAGVGITVMLVAISAHSQKLILSISQYYKDTVATEAGGGNIVNVILVDYRGFDTLFEITVLSIAGIGVLAMIKLRLAKKEDTDENK